MKQTKLKDTPVTLLEFMQGKHEIKQPLELNENEMYIIIISPKSIIDIRFKTKMVKTEE